MHTLTIPGFHPPALNAWHGGHWAKRHRLKTRWYTIVGAHAYDQQVPKASGKVRVTLRITLAPRQRGADVDAYWKSTLDALVEFGLLVDDSPRWVEILPVQYVRGTEEATTITLEPL